MKEKRVTFQWQAGAFITIDDPDLYDLFKQYGAPNVAHLETEDSHEGVNLVSRESPGKGKEGSGAVLGELGGQAGYKVCTESSSDRVGLNLPTTQFSG
jgi:hypothetical protein